MLAMLQQANIHRPLVYSYLDVFKLNHVYILAKPVYSNESGLHNRAPRADTTAARALLSGGGVLGHRAAPRRAGGVSAVQWQRWRARPMRRLHVHDGALHCAPLHADAAVPPPGPVSRQTTPF